MVEYKKAEIGEERKKMGINNIDLYETVDIILFKHLGNALDDIAKAVKEYGDITAGDIYRKIDVMDETAEVINDICNAVESLCGTYWRVIVELNYFGNTYYVKADSRAEAIEMAIKHYQYMQGCDFDNIAIEEVPYSKVNKNNLI